MTAEELAECFVPVPMRWRHIKPGDVIVGRSGTLWIVLATASGDGFSIKIRRDDVNEWIGGVDPDEVVTVLLPAGLRDAMELTRDQLGAQLLERRAAA